MGADERAAGTPGWNAIHDCAHPHGPRVRLRQAGNVGGASDGAGLYGCGCHSSSPHDRRASARGGNHGRDRRTGRPGTTPVPAIRHLLMTDELQHAVVTMVEIGALAAYERPLPTMAEYNQLLTIEVLA